MTSIETVSLVNSHGGVQGVYKHASEVTGTEMTFSVFVPAHNKGDTLPVVYFLSGLTCTAMNVTEKGEFRKACAELGLILVAPDTSPRGDTVADDGAYDMGQGAGFYVNATEEPWKPHYQMRSYIENELPELIAQHFPVDMGRQGIMGHSMGGHGALTIGIRNPDVYKTISAFAPICSPRRCPWGQKALGLYLGDDQEAWREYDATALLEDRGYDGAILVDQGTADTFLEDQLKPNLLEQACAKSKTVLTLRYQDGYDHSYYFISTFMEDHLRWHAKHLG